MYNNDDVKLKTYIIAVRVNVVAIQSSDKEWKDVANWFKDADIMVRVRNKEKIDKVGKTLPGQLKTLGANGLPIGIENPEEHTYPTQENAYLGFGCLFHEDKEDEGTGCLKK